MNEYHKKTPICVYDDFIIFEGDGETYVLDQNGLRQVKEVHSLCGEEYDNLPIEDILATCEVDYDYSGELDDVEEYIFWALVENGENQTVNSDDAKAVINNIITYAGDRFTGEDLYYFVRNILYDVIRF